MSRMIRVWDPLVRYGHWALVALFITAYISEDDFLVVHTWAGYGIAIIVVTRILWGFFGPAHARFSDFVYRPSAVLSYMRDLALFRAKRYIGHSPAGGAMVVALLLSLAATTGTGMLAFAVRYERGPLAQFVVADPSQPPPDIAAAKAQRRIDRRGRTIKEIHEILVNLTLFLIAFHIGGVALASLVHRENLPQSMVTGDKRVD